MTPDPEFRALIHSYTGEVSEIRRTKYGFSSDLTAIVECEKGPFFVKAMRNRPGGRKDSITRERLVNEFVQPISPALRWYSETQGWIVLGFEAVDGRPSDLTPGSPDLPMAVGLVDGLGSLSLPRVARGWAETRWDRFAACEADAELFRGDALLHTDVNPDNVLIGRSGWLVDWSWPTRGAAFIDPAVLVVQLVAAGHAPQAAEAYAAQCRAWVEADARAIDAFALANLGMYRGFVERQPDATWLKAMVDAVQSWASHRGVLNRPQPMS
jgi:hypothetical protein